MRLHLSREERDTLPPEMGRATMKVLYDIEGTCAVQWGALRDRLFPGVADRARELHEARRMHPVEAVILATREYRRRLHAEMERHFEDLWMGG